LILQENFESQFVHGDACRGAWLYATAGKGMSAQCIENFPTVTPSQIKVISSCLSILPRENQQKSGNISLC
jgi:hypothetical protein